MRTLVAGRRYAANNSGMMKMTTNHPHVSSLKERSCHRATKVNITSMERTVLLLPPRGM